MTPKLLVSPRTASQVDAFVTEPSHGLLILGPAGSGKYALALSLVQQLLGFTDQQSLLKHPYFYQLKRPDDRQEIPIDSIRQLIKKMNLKTLGGNNLRRAVIIEEAQYLSQESQNALLKLLEEPPTDTVFVLTATSENNLLATTLSRLQKLRVYPIATKQAISYFKTEYNEADIESANLLAQGSAGLVNALLQDKKDHPLKKAVEDFKTLLSQDRYSRLKTLDSLDKNKPELNMLLDAGSRILSVLHKDSLRKGNSAQAQRMLRSRKRILQINTKLNANTSARLAIMSFALSLEV